MYRECEGGCDSSDCLLCTKLTGETDCGNEKCIMCSHHTPGHAPSHAPSKAGQQSAAKPPDPRPPLPKKTVAPYQEYKVTEFSFC